jgi:hypothetical protein
MSVQLQAEANLEDRLVASARLLEDMAQTCAVLRATCLEQASLLRELSANPDVLGSVGLAERALTQQLYIQRPHVRHLADARE